MCRPVEPVGCPPPGMRRSTARRQVVDCLAGQEDGAIGLQRCGRIRSAEVPATHLGNVEDLVAKVVVRGGALGWGRNDATSAGGGGGGEAAATTASREAVRAWATGSALLGGEAVFAG